MASLDFLSGPGNAELAVFQPGADLEILDIDKQAVRIPGLNMGVIKANCWNLASAFEKGEDGLFRAVIQAVSTDTVIHFLRFLYTGTYLPDGELDLSACRISVHAELFSMGKDFDLPKLSTVARGNFLLHAELACSYSKPPVDLCYCIQYIYQNLPNETSLLDTLLSFCCQNFQYHGLVHLKGFKELNAIVPDFPRDLVRAAFRRHHEDEGAADIIRYGDIVDPSKNSDNSYDTFLRGLCHEVYYESDGEDKAAKVMEREKMCSDAGFVLVHRPKNATEIPSSDEDSDHDDFHVVRRREVNAASNEDHDWAFDDVYGSDSGADALNQHTYVTPGEIKRGFPPSSSFNPFDANVAPGATGSLYPFQTNSTSSADPVATASAAELFSRIPTSTIAALSALEPSYNSFPQPTSSYGTILVSPQNPTHVPTHVPSQGPSAPIAIPIPMPQANQSRAEEVDSDDGLSDWSLA